MLLEVARSGTVLRNGARGRDMVGGDRVAQHREHPRALDVHQRGRLGGQVLEERRVLDVGAVRIPCVPASFRHRQVLPFLVAVKHRAVLAGEQFRRERGRDGVGNLLL